LYITPSPADPQKVNGHVQVLRHEVDEAQRGRLVGHAEAVAIVLDCNVTIRLGLHAARRRPEAW
jgi:hypothetical protein